MGTAYIWDDYEEARWYNYRPGTTDYNQLTEALGGYISMYQSESMEISPEMTM